MRGREDLMGILKASLIPLNMLCEGTVAASYLAGKCFRNRRPMLIKEPFDVAAIHGVNVKMRTAATDAQIAIAPLLGGLSWNDGFTLVDLRGHIVRNIWRANIEAVISGDGSE